MHACILHQKTPAPRTNTSIIPREHLLLSLTARPPLSANFEHSKSLLSKGGPNVRNVSFWHCAQALGLYDPPGERPRRGISPAVQGLVVS